MIGLLTPKPLPSRNPYPALQLVLIMGVSFFETTGKTT